MKNPPTELEELEHALATAARQANPEAMLAYVGAIATLGHAREVIGAMPRRELLRFCRRLGVRAGRVTDQELRALVLDLGRPLRAAKLAGILQARQVFRR